MSNAIDLKNNEVEFTSDEFDVAGFAEIHRQHELHTKADLESSDLFCWFIRFNFKYERNKVIIRFGDGQSSHTWRDFAQTINFLKSFMKREKKHTFKISDENNFKEYFNKEIIFGKKYDNFLAIKE